MKLEERKEALSLARNYAIGLIENAEHPFDHLNDEQEELVRNELLQIAGVLSRWFSELNGR